jgi:C1A family cysteine protease
MTARRATGSKNNFVGKRGYGWVPDRPDQRDYLFSALRKVPAKLPGQVDLRLLCPKVEDQGQLGSCTANALAGAIEFLERKDNVIGLSSPEWETLQKLGKAERPDLKKRLPSGRRVPFQDFSRLFIYYNERALEHTVSSDSGAMIRDGIKTLAKQGACSEKSWPYDIAKFKSKPGPACYQEALLHQITSYHRILTLDQMRTCLAEGFPFVFGFTVYESFESQEVARTGIVTMPKPREQVLGGHAVLAVGYDDSNERFLVRNSWGTDWGLKGYFTMPYKYLGNRNLSDDFWTILRGELMVSRP